MPNYGQSITRAGSTQAMTGFPDQAFQARLSPFEDETWHIGFLSDTEEKTSSG